MKFRLTYVAGVFLVFFGVSALAKAPLAERHAAGGVECSACHGKVAPAEGVEVESTACQSCHGDYPALAQRTLRHGKSNPHASHLGEVDCTVCHRGHSPSESYCQSCHQDLPHLMN